MAQYWLQTPIENAKEVVQRFIDSNSATLTNYAGMEVTYDYETEVIFYNFANNYPTYDNNVIYFGSFIFASQESSIELAIDDGSGQILTFDSLNIISQPLEAGIYPYVMWNAVNSSANGSVYFVGYKFTLA